MYTQIHFQGDTGSFGIGDREEDAFTFVILMIQLDNSSFEFYCQSFDAVEFFRKSSDGIVGNGVSDEIEIKILCCGSGRYRKCIS